MIFITENLQIYHELGIHERAFKQILQLRQLMRNDDDSICPDKFMIA